MVRRLLRRPVVIGAIGVGCAIPVFNASAQRAEALIAESAVTASPRVTVDFVHVPVRTAVHTIAQQAGLKSSYDATVIPVNTYVTLRARNMPVDDAFQKVLQGTGLTALVQVTGNVIITRGADSLESGTIVGKVIDAKTKQPIRGAIVTTEAGHEAEKTRDDGAFRLNVPAGEHTVHIRALGFARQSKRVSVGAEQSVLIEISLERSTSVLDEVVVTGTVIATERKAIPTPITVITAEEIEKRGITRIEEFLRGEIPGVVAIEQGSQRYSAGTLGQMPDFGAMASTTVYSRGASSLTGAANPLKTYIDGVELLDASYLGTIDPASIERIEVITGPQAATIYGSGAMGGVMQIFTKRGSSQQASDITATLLFGLMQNSVTTSYTPTHNHRLSMSGGSGPTLSYAGNLSYTYSGQWQPALYARSYGGQLGVTHLRDAWTFNGAVSMTGGNNGTNDGTANPISTEKVLTGEWDRANLGQGGNSRVALSSSQTLSLNVDWRPGGIWQHHLTLGRNQSKFEVRPNAPRFFNAADSLYAGGTSAGDRMTLAYNTTVVPQWNGPVSTTLTVGANGARGTQLRTSGCLASASSSSYVSCNGAVSGLRLTKSLDDKNWGGFASWQVGFFHQLFFTFGLRGEQNPSYGREHKIDWTPTNGVTYTMEYGPLTVKLLGSYGRATRPPPPEAKLEQLFTCRTCVPWQIVSLFANPELRPERSKGPQGGIEVYWGNIGSFTLNRYDQKVSDLIQRIVIDSVWRDVITNPANSGYLKQSINVNVGTVRQHGWEGTASLQIAGLSLKGTYSWTDSRILSFDVREYCPSCYSFEVGKTFLATPTHTGNLSLGYARGATSINLISNWVGSSISNYLDNPFYANNRRSRIPAYVESSKAATGTNFWLGARNPGYTKSDLVISHRVKPWATANVNIKNIGNRFNNDILRGAFPTLGRQTSFGVTLRLPQR